LPTATVAGQCGSLDTIGWISYLNPNQPVTNMSDTPPCPQCQSEYAYEDGEFLVCTECDHRWNPGAEPATEEKKVWRDAFGNELKDGDTVQVIKDLKVKGASSSVKVGTKVKNIRLVDGDHDIDCRIDGFGAMKLKSEFLKKA